jgi:hypothetical protein
LQSVGDIDKAKGNSAVHEAEANFSFPSITINTPTDADQINEEGEDELDGEDEEVLDEDFDGEEDEHEDQDDEDDYMHSSSVVRLNIVDEKSAFLPIRLLEDQLYK